MYIKVIASQTSDIFLRHSILLTGQVSMQLCSQPTNEVTYFRAVSSIVDLPSHLKPYVPLFCNIVTKY